MRLSAGQSLPDADARLLLLISAFSQGASAMEGRLKLAKLDFFLRYPSFLQRALRIRQGEVSRSPVESDVDIDSRMVRYRYGPWDPQHFAILGRLIGKGLIVTVPVPGGIGYKATEVGTTTAKRIAGTQPWSETETRIQLLKRHLNLNGTNLKQFVYDNFPEVTQSSWGKKL